MSFRLFARYHRSTTKRLDLKGNLSKSNSLLVIEWITFYLPLLHRFVSWCSSILFRWGISRHWHTHCLEVSNSNDVSMVFLCNTLEHHLQQHFILYVFPYFANNRVLLWPHIYGIFYTISISWLKHLEFECSRFHSKEYFLSPWGVPAFMGR
jgi:hypothetical protein